MKIQNIERFENSKVENEISDKDLEYFDANTPENINHIKITDCKSYTKEELKQLYDDFAGYINNDVEYENDGKDIDNIPQEKEYGNNYKQTGLHNVSWSKDKVDNTDKKVVLPIGEKIIQYSHNGISGKYFAPVGTSYNDLQLPDSKDKRTLTIYEVVGNFQVEVSKIAKQYFNKNSKSKFNETVQYKSDMTADKLIEMGILKKSRQDD